MIKVVNLVSLIAAPIIVKYSSYSLGVVLIAVILFAFIAWAILRSKRPTPQVDAQSAGD
jgi:K(+)-stimulated pyrophosphate-energized sodium pump